MQYLERTPNTIWNYSLAGLHAALAVGTGIWFFAGKKNNNIETKLFNTNFSIRNDIYVPVPEQAWNISLTYVKILVVLFFLITAVFHLFYATNGFGSGIYSRMIQQGSNWIRWVEYAITATIMIFIIAVISGVSDFGYVIMLICAFPLVMIQGEVVEKYLVNKNVESCILPTLGGWLVLVGAFFIIVTSFNRRINEVKKAGYNIPSWLYAVVYPMIIWFASFGVVQIFQIYMVSRNKGDINYNNYERTYLVLSLLSKAFLGLWVAYGLTR